MHAPPGNLPPGFRGEGTPACCRLTAPESVDPSRSCDVMSEIATVARTWCSLCIFAPSTHRQSPCRAYFFE